ncbi:1-hydroxycarotenoid 3,4-desaturase CrtD [Limnohabitans sp.]|uniref:1-hydroxycarotenoid 3,4-desaturase CrtD n=1 Tax=Limnohabitans sp. TaxID=1907725 RepID=UPI0033421E6A
MHKSKRTPRVVVVGAGIGGLVSALVLAHRGLDVTLVESASQPGGKIRQVLVDGVGVDSGPTVFTMRWVLDQMLETLGTSLEDILQLEPIDVLARHAWDASPQRLDLYSDTARTADAIAQFSSPQEARRFLNFCQQTQRLYDTLEKPYIRSQRPSLVSMVSDLGFSGMATLTGLGPFATLWQSLGRHFHDPRLQQLFGRYATYCGSSPWSAPATLMLVAQVELDGVWSVKGGMFQVASALSKLGETHGVKSRYGVACSQILTSQGKVCGVQLSSGEHIEADHVIFNGDVAALASGMLGSSISTSFEPVPPNLRSLSAMTLSMHAKTSGFPLVRHNVFFNQDYQAEFEDIFHKRQLPSQGTVYVCAQDRNDTGLAEPALERILCLVNAPPDGDIHSFNTSEIQACESSSMALMRRCGLEIEVTPQQVVRTLPQDFARLFPGSGGALYGQATHGWMSAFRRPSARSKVPGLYTAGGSVHPGPGVPMAAMSGRLAAATLMEDLGLTKPSRRVVISGGMSMR